MDDKRQKLRWTIVRVAVLAAILLPFVKCVRLSALLNLRLSAVYGADDASAACHTFVPALAALVLLPWLVMWVSNTRVISCASCDELLKKGDPT